MDELGFCEASDQISCDHRAEPYPRICGAASTSGSQTGLAGCASNDGDKDHGPPLWDLYLSISFQHLVLSFHSSQHTVLQLNVSISVCPTGLELPVRMNHSCFSSLAPVVLVESLVDSR